MSINTYYPKNVNEKIQRIVVLDGDDAPNQEHMGYSIEIHTENGVITIDGCHDLGPDLDGGGVLEDN